MKKIDWPRLLIYIACAALPALIASVEAHHTTTMMLLQVGLSVAITVRAYIDQTHSTSESSASADADSSAE